MRNTDKLLKFALVLFFAGSLFASKAKTVDTPEQTTKDFYGWYLKQISGEGSHFNKRAVLKYVSKRLDKWYLSPAYESYDADYFIDAQDFDDKWQAAATKAVIKGNTAMLKVILAVPKPKKSDWTNTLAVKLIKEDGAWKIDSVNNRKLTVD